MTVQRSTFRQTHPQGLFVLALFDGMERNGSSTASNVQPENPLSIRKDDCNFLESDRRSAFEGIQYFYQSLGRLRRPETVPIDIFMDEVRFFDLDRSIIDKFLIVEGRQLLLELEIIGIDWSNPFSVIDFVCTCWFSCESHERKIYESDLFFQNAALRVFRVFKLSRYSNGLRILGKTIKASLEELFLLLFFMMIALVIFSTAIYCVEDHKNFESIPEAFWFTI
uniref:Ion transport domain-containing protein n=1 Tax=Romanomermis culicivorax TaxID=13658 RepID=A0A915JEG7_ROMCU